jgi:hypothetical protein
MKLFNRDFMADDLKLKTNREPTIFNKEMAIGLMAGVMLPGVGLIGALIAAAAGTVVGGLIGRSRMQDEKTHGKTVSEETSFWNKDALLGGLLGGFVGQVTAVAAMVALSIPLSPVALVATLLGSMALGAAAGGYIGGSSGENNQKAEYEEAKKQTIVEHLSHNVSPEVGKAVEYSMEHNKEWGF